MKVAKSTPNASETAIGTTNIASKLCTSISGARPKKVVSEVSKIGLNRETPASRTAVSRSSWRSRLRLMNVTMTRLSLTTTPARATSPNIDISVTSSPITACPQTAPTRPKGIALMMISGCTYDFNGIAAARR